MRFVLPLLRPSRRLHPLVRVIALLAGAAVFCLLLMLGAMALLVMLAVGATALVVHAVQSRFGAQAAAGAAHDPRVLEGHCVVVDSRSRPRSRSRSQR